MFEAGPEAKYELGKKDILRVCVGWSVRRIRLDCCLSGVLSALYDCMCLIVSDEEQMGGPQQAINTSEHVSTRCWNLQEPILREDSGKIIESRSEREESSSRGVHC